MIKDFKILCLMIFSSLLIQSLSSQPVTVNARIDSTVMWIGNQTQLTFEISQGKGQHVKTPLFSDTIPGGLELVEKVKSDTVQSQDGHLLINQRYTVTAFEDSLLYIPPFPFVYDNDTVWSKSLSVKIVQPYVIDTASNTLADIKDVFNPKFDWKGFLLKVLFGILMLVLAFLIYVLIRRIIQRKPVFEIKKTEPELPAHVVALAALDKIKQEKPWQHNRDKEYHTELTDVIRVYIEKVFGVTAMEMTSDEILEHLRFMYSDKKETFYKLRQILSLADLVKFAKWKAIPDEHELSLSNAYNFVNETKLPDEIHNEAQENPQKS
jgi:hypothetical protein